ncbi:hypothetical protein LGM88_40920, partial [Burkholderia contaminans]|uniref:hypothetical protein n=1 Tax=Burkholderia contaminans TaxID=488447 RepID=UPI001CF26578
AVICKLMRLNAARELRISFMKTMRLMTARLMIEIRAQLVTPPVTVGRTTKGSATWLAAEFDE